MVDVWGELPKSALDSTLIEDEIGEQITIHDESGTAHRGTGGSMTEHIESDPVEHVGVIHLKSVEEDPDDDTAGALCYRSDLGRVRFYGPYGWTSLTPE